MRLFVSGSLVVACSVLLSACRSRAEAIKPGPDTTVFTGPVRPDGTIDYLAALNQKYSKDVTPANNAFVAIANMMAPDAWPSTKFRHRVYQLLKANEPADNATYFVTWDTFSDPKGITRSGNKLEIPRLAMAHPWKAADNPTLARWIKANAAFIGSVRLAMKKRYWFCPLVQKRHNAEGMPDWPWIVTERRLAFLILDRAALRWGSGDRAGAWRDLLLVHELGRQTAQPASLLTQIVAISIDGLAHQAAVGLIESSTISPHEARKAIADLHNLAPPPSIAKGFDVLERCLFLGTIERMYHGDLPAIYQKMDDTFGTHEQPISEAAMHELGRSDCDINAVLRQVNNAFDTLVATAKNPSYLLARKKIKALENRWGEQAKPAGSSLHPKPRLSYSLRRLIDITFLPSSLAARARAGMQDQMEQIALALAAYRTEHHHYPAELTSLSPDYLPAIPRDVFTGKPLHYQINSDGSAILYSVGVNMKDDGGKQSDDPTKGDLVIQLQGK